MIEFNPVVLICTHQRKEITSENITRLLSENVKPKIVLVVTHPSEGIYFANAFSEIHILITPNFPLGAKWQAGVNEAKIFNPNPLIITGSDDFLGPDFVEHTKNYIDSGLDFVGLSWFYMQKPKANERVICRYLRKEWPLGGGRFYSLSLLQKMQFHLFEINQNKNLDNYGFETAKKLCPNSYKVIWEPSESPLSITAIKGPWQTMNGYDEILRSKYINILMTEKICVV